MKSACGHAIDEITCSYEGFVPKPNWKAGVSKERNAGLDNMLVLVFGNAVLLGGVQAPTHRNEHAQEEK